MDSDKQLKSSEQSSHDAIYALRTVNQNQTQLVILADQKANILIGVVVVIMTILFARNKLSFDGAISQILPFAIFFVMEIIAAFLALLVIIPKNIDHAKLASVNDMTNPLFFGVFTKAAEEDYVEYMMQRLRDDHAARVMLVRDIYQTGGVLKRKYVLLKYAYAIAILGVTIPVLIALSDLW